MIEILRFCARIIATSIFAISFGVIWIGFVLFIGSMFQVFDFLSGDRFSWKEHVTDCNEFFCEPFRSLWKRRSV